MRLHVVVEGQTEETFARDVLAPHLANFRVYADARLVEISRTHHRVFRGGVKTYASIKRDLQYWMREDSSPDVRFTTMLDFYGLPWGLSEPCRFP
jgi:hypothetical protein